MTDSRHADTSKNNTAKKLVKESMKLSDDAGDLATIRDILFGDQVKDVEKKRQDLHQEFSQNLSTLQKETRAQFEKISTDIQALHKLLNDEMELRQTENKETHQQISQLKSSLDKSNTQHQDAQDKLKANLHQETLRLETQAKQWNEEISAKLEVAAKELKSDKADRGDLAKLLHGVAEKLLDESN